MKENLTAVFKKYLQEHIGYVEEFSDANAQG